MSPALVKMDNPIEGRARSCRWETSNTLVTRAERAFAGIAGPPALCPHNILFGGRKMWAEDEMGARGRGDGGRGEGRGGYLRQEHHHHQDLWGVWETQVAPLAAAPLMMLN